MSLHRLGRPLCAYINRAAFVANVREVERRCPNSRAILVIKANAYGHGLVEIARLAGDHDLAVATSDEAQVLVDAGIDNRIWVLEGPLNLYCLTLATRHEIVWVVHSPEQLPLLQAYAHLPLKLAIKIDTGMHRLGFSREQLTEASAILRALSNVDVIASMTHFACSDEVNHSSVAEQISLFEQYSQHASLDDLPQNLSNSGAILFYPEAHRDWVRPGIMLYGAMPEPHGSAHKAGLRAVMQLRSAVIALHDVAEGEGVGYGARWRAQRPSRIATVAVGYADGYPRHAPNGTPVLVNSERVPLVGRVSMDMITVDVTDLVDVQVGDEVELWGTQLPVDEVALAADTIAYDLLTGVSARVPREYC